jgi:four helix bundle protein
MNNEELKERTKKFAFRCIRLATSLSDNKVEQYIRMQLVELSTSSAVNIRAAFLSDKNIVITDKLSKALEEIDGCCFWIECIITEAIKREGKVNPLLAEALELRNGLFQLLNNTGKNEVLNHELNTGLK